MGKEKKKKEEKVYSLRGKLIYCWSFASIMLLFVILLYGGNSIWRYRRELIDGNHILAENNAEMLNKDIASMKKYVGNMYSDNVNYQNIKNSPLSEIDWIEATYFLNNTMESKAGSIDYFGGIFFYDVDKNALRSCYSDYPFAGDSYRLNKALKEKLKAVGEETIYRGFFEYEGEQYLVYSNGTRGKMVGFLINLNRYFSNDIDLQYVFYRENGKVISDSGEHILDNEELYKAYTNEKTIYNGFQFVISSAEIDAFDCKFAVIRSTGIILEFWKKWEFWMTFILIPLIIVAAFAATYRVLNKVMYQFINHLLYRVTQMKSNEAGLEHYEEPHIKEFIEINGKLDAMLGEIAQLQEEKYRKELEANAAKLQYYQLQVNPHFFLNCLNIIDSLLSKKDTSTVKNMIMALSHHFRYVFRDRQKEVTIQEEIEEINDYCNIYIIKGGAPILFKSNLAPGTLECEIPILGIQTFVENSIKHATNAAQILSIQVATKIIENQGKNYLSILISDNGPGYPEEMLEQLNEPVHDFYFKSKHVGIDNIKYRIYLRYGLLGKVYFYNNPQGGSATEIVLPMEEFTNELTGN